MIQANNIEQANECDLQAVLYLQKAAFMEVAKHRCWSLKMVSTSKKNNRV